MYRMKCDRGGDKWRGAAVKARVASPAIFPRMVFLLVFSLLVLKLTIPIYISVLLISGRWKVLLIALLLRYLEATHNSVDCSVELYLSLLLVSGYKLLFSSALYCLWRNINLAVKMDKNRFLKPELPVLMINDDVNNNFLSFSPPLLLKWWDWEASVDWSVCQYLLSILVWQGPDVAHKRPEAWCL